MSRRQEDFDEFCDPENPKIIKYEDIVEATKRVRKHIVATPIVERGAINALELLPRDKQKVGVVLASLGNQAIGICFYGHKIGVPVTVVMPTCVPIAKLQMCHNLSAKVIIQGKGLMEAQRYARIFARDKGLTYINGRDYPNILTGYGSIAIEILEQLPNVDAIMVPVGTGGLLAAIGTVVKHAKPSCLVYGVQPERIPTFFNSIQSGEPTTLPYEPSIAESIAMPYVGVNAFGNAQRNVDKLVLVKDDWIARAILHLVEDERFVVEGAGACPLAAILGNLVPEFKAKNVVCILSGGNIDAVLLSRCLDRGRAAEGRLIKFKVLVKDSAVTIEQFMRLIANGGYNILRQFCDRIWIENEISLVEVKLVCECRNLNHALELKRLIERTYPNKCSFESEPFNLDRTCPCYAHK